jgi:hypothetical protein
MNLSVITGVGETPSQKSPLSTPLTARLIYAEHPDQPRAGFCSRRGDTPPGLPRHGSQPAIPTVTASWILCGGGTSPGHERVVGQRAVCASEGPGVSFTDALLMKYRVCRFEPSLSSLLRWTSQAFPLMPGRSHQMPLTRPSVSTYRVTTTA